MAAILEFQMSISQTFEELQDSKLKFKLITPKPITGTYFDTNLSKFHLAGLPMEAILDFQMSIFQPFEELQDSNSEFKLITPKPITGTCFDINMSRFGLAGLHIVTILDF